MALCALGVREAKFSSMLELRLTPPAITGVVVADGSTGAAGWVVVVVVGGSVVVVGGSVVVVVVGTVVVVGGTVVFLIGGTVVVVDRPFGLGGRYAIMGEAWTASVLSLPTPVSACSPIDGLDAVEVVELQYPQKRP